MAPKRGAATSASQAKKSRSSSEGTDGSAAAQPAQPAIPRNKRWAAVSASANADMDYRMATQNPLTAYNFVCFCQAPFPNGDDSDDEEEKEEEDGDEEGDDAKIASSKRPRCDGGETCLCEKPASEHPNHIWKLSVAGRRLYFTQHIHFELRDPDSFGMYTFNDHAGYGVLELLQNLILDFEEAAGNYKEQWAVCEALSFFLHTDVSAIMTRIGDGHTVDFTYELLGRLFVSMLATLERENLLAKDSPIQSLSLVMALFLSWAQNSRRYGILDESKQESIGAAKDKKKWYPHAFDSQVLAYARKYEIDLVGPHDIDVAIAKVESGDGTEDLPAPGSDNKDPFGFTKTLKKYKSEFGGVTAFVAGSGPAQKPKSAIGGDALDITTWKSAERKRKAFDNRDPLGKKEIDAIKQGMVMQLG